MPLIERADVDRRSAADRRHVYDLDYFQNGGIERRRRKVHTMLDPAIDRRKGDRRKRTLEERPQKVIGAYTNLLSEYGAKI